MKIGRKFSHFEIFKVIVSALYITGGLFLFSLWCSFASIYVEENYFVEKTIEQEMIMCENCDEID